MPKSSSPSSSRRSSPASTSKGKSPIAKQPRVAGEIGTIVELFRQSKEVEALSQPEKPEFDLADKEPDDTHQQQQPPARQPCDASSAAPAHVPLTKTEEDELRAFDLDYSFGPCAGPTRLVRWERAAKFGLNPPQRVKDILQGRPLDDPAMKSILAKNPYVF